jgi:hypothetical protein
MAPDELKQVLDQIDISNTRQYTISLSTGWPSLIEFEKKVNVGAITNNTESFTIREL